MGKIPRLCKLWNQDELYKLCKVLFTTNLNYLGILVSTASAIHEDFSLFV